VSAGVARQAPGQRATAADPAGPRTVVLPGREGAGGLAGERADRRQGQAGARKGFHCQPSPPGVSFVAMLVPGPVTALG